MFQVRRFLKYFWLLRSLLGLGLGPALWLVSCTQGQVGWDYPAPVISDVTLTTVSIQNTQVDIHGNGFLAGAQVLVGNTACLQVTYVSPTELICTLPPNTPVHNGETVQVINADKKITRGAVPPRPALSLSVPAITVAGQCSSVLVSYQDATGKSARAPSAFAVTLGVSPSSPSARLYSDVNCLSSISGFTFPNAQSSTTIYFRDTASETVWIVAQAPSLLEDLAPVQISVGPANQIALEGFTNEQVRVCNPIKIWVNDAFGNHAITQSAITVSLSTSLGGPGVVKGTFHTSSNCSGIPVTTTTIPAGAGFVDIFYQDPDPQAVTITAAGTVNGNTSSNILSVNTVPFWASWGGSAVVGALSNYDATPSPGGRLGSGAWVASDNSMWLFGGNGLDSTGLGTSPLLNDLWKYDGSVWTVKSGHATQTAAQNGSYGTSPGTVGFPGGREGAVALSDGGMGAWLFGGDGCDKTACSSSRVLNDLWSYDGNSGQWTWRGGLSTANSPGNYVGPGYLPMARTGASGWMTSPIPNPFFFGGQGLSGTLLNDVWSYDPSGNTWQPLFALSPPYGHVDSFSGTVYPGGRKLASSWSVSANQTWVFGGWGNTTSGSTQGPLNDVWVFNNASSWFSVSGQNSYLHPTSYGIQNTPNSSNWPGPRYGAVTWVDSSRFVSVPTPTYTIWLFGGVGYDVNGTLGELSDLWMAQVTQDVGANYLVTWTWVAGPQTANALGIYGANQALGANFVPGARKTAVGWLAPQNHLFLFGGFGFDAANPGLLNDIWQLFF